MSADARKSVWGCSPYKGSALLVHLAVADVVNDMHGNEFWASIDKLAAKCRLGRSAVSSALRTMVADGALVVLAEGGGRGNPTRYRFVEPAETNRSVDGLGDDKPRDPGAQTARSDADTARSADLSPLTQPKQPKGTESADRLIESVSSVDVVFAAWLECASPSGRARLDKNRTRLITNALRDYPVEEVVAAVRGWQNDPWHRERRKCDLGYLLRDAEHIEKFRDLWNNPPKGDARRGRAVDNDREGPSGRIQL